MKKKQNNKWMETPCLENPIHFIFLIYIYKKKELLLFCLPILYSFFTHDYETYVRNVKKNDDE